MPNRNTDTQSAPKTAPEKPRPDNEAAKALNADEKSGKPGEGAQKKWDIIDEHAWESFPASDPPASWAGRDIAPQDRADGEPEAQSPKKDS